MTAAFFVDSNVLVYRRDASEPDKQPLAERWLSVLWHARRGRLSVQVLEEFYHVVTRKLSPGLDPEDARDEVRELCSWKPIPRDPDLLEAAWSIEQRYQLSFWDSLIVGAANMAGCDYLLSEDLQDGSVLAGVQVVDPFVHPPSDFGF